MIPLKILPISGYWESSFLKPGVKNIHDASENLF
jgi:hypothetical protein